MRLTREGEGVVLDAGLTVRALELGERPGRHAPFLRSIRRPIDYDLVSVGERDENSPESEFNYSSAGSSQCSPIASRNGLLALTGIDPLASARKAGHTSVAFTYDRYRHLLPEVDKQAATKLEALRNYGCKLERKPIDYTYTHRVFSKI